MVTCVVLSPKADVWPSKQVLILLARKLTSAVSHFRFSHHLLQIVNPLITLFVYAPYRTMLLDGMRNTYGKAVKHMRSTDVRMWCFWDVTLWNETCIPKPRVDAEHSDGRSVSTLPRTKKLSGEEVVLVFIYTMGVSEWFRFCRNSEFTRRTFYRKLEFALVYRKPKFRKQRKLSGSGWI